MRKIAALVLSVLGWGCSTDTLPPSNVVFLSGQETDLWTANPAPAKIQVDLVESAKRTSLGEAPATSTGMTIPTGGVPLDVYARFDASALDTTSAVVAHGSSLTFYLSELYGLTIPIFVARSGGWSRAPDKLEHAHRRPVVVTALDEYVIAAGGDPVPGVDGSVPDFYDLANWSTLRSQPPLPRAPKSAAVLAGVMLVIDATGATWLDLGNDAVEQAVAPDGLSFAEIAGGDTVRLSDGTQLIVGATRSSGDPTSKILRIAPDRTLSALSLITPRLGAAAGVAADKLVVAGGSTEGAGVEVLNDAKTAFVTLGVPADPTIGLGLAALDGTTVLLAGGKDSVSGAAASARTLDVGCGATCAITDLGPLPSLLTGARVFRLDTGKALVLGDTDDGETHVLLASTASGKLAVTETPLRERRKGATATLLPNGQVGVIGGVSVDGTDTALSTLEAFFP
jgi:hypothetical protein